MTEYLSTERETDASQNLHFTAVVTKIYINNPLIELPRIGLYWFCRFL